MSYIADHIMTSLLDRVYIFLLLITYIYCTWAGYGDYTALSKKNHTSNHFLISAQPVIVAGHALLLYKYSTVTALN